MNEIDPNDPLFPMMHLDNINILRAEIDALAAHLEYLISSNAAAIEIAITKQSRQTLIKQLDQYMGY